METLSKAPQPAPATNADVGIMPADALRRAAVWAIYGLYERHLLWHVRRAPVPRHVGLILDGNRRFARRRNLTDPREIYGAGAEKLDDLLEWCAELAIPAITLWVFSTDNFERSPEEISGILAAVETKLGLLAKDPQIHRQRVRVRAVGRLELLPGPTLAAVRAAEAATAAYDGMQLTIAAAYGGRQEITDAVQAFLREQQKSGKMLDEVIAQVTPETISRYLYAPDLPDPELIIRTSGEIRLSGFLLWQSAYSEFYFTDVFWPALRKIDFLRAVRSFQQRRRRFGR
ncbi:MAG: short-chain Z-isoprenyl diphosphate synthase [Rhodospirillaceae bacterium]|jgi:short-chain Z-isoprenyl diphosphate synthase|nr:short-chain Z-isoprenyl diphosphate synthase [Rhodospirillaceae bacterium]